MKRLFHYCLLVGLTGILITGCGRAPLKAPPGKTVEVGLWSNQIFDPKIKIAGESIDIDKEGNINITNPHFLGSDVGWVIKMKITDNKIILVIPPGEPGSYYCNITLYSPPIK